LGAVLCAQTSEVLLIGAGCILLAEVDFEARLRAGRDDRL